MAQRAPSLHALRLPTIPGRRCGSPRWIAENRRGGKDWTHISRPGRARGEV
jgi:hypothetical protein